MITNHQQQLSMMYYINLYVTLTQYSVDKFSKNQCWKQILLLMGFHSEGIQQVELFWSLILQMPPNKRAHYQDFQMIAAEWCQELCQCMASYHCMQNKLAPQCMFLLCSHSVCLTLPLLMTHSCTSHHHNSIGQW